MKVKVERTGGFTGVPVNNEINSDDLPELLKTTVTKMINEDVKLPLKSVPKGSADYYSYKITLDDGQNKRVIECNQFNIQHNLKSLISYIEKHPK